jgi:hypothetical protein
MHGFLVAAVTLVMLAPWWRNHRYLRDFYDYGLVIAGNARIGAGERPYADFLTPIQTGLYVFNGWAEQLGGGTYQAMTLGAAVLTALCMVLVFAVLIRQWPFFPSVALAAAFTAMTASQHTIIWHNTVGALCIAVAACCAAVAPVWSFARWPWHLLIASALLVGGITKLNAHLVAVAGVAAWALYAGALRRSPWPKVMVTLGLVMCCAIIAPLAVELVWTQAEPRTWWYNVVQLPLGGRSGDFAHALEWKFYFTVHHDYYGALLVPQLGALGILVTGIFALMGIRAVGVRQSGWVIAAALFAAGSGAGLLATNYEIAYVAMGAWFALVIALWLGFGLRSSGPAFHLGLVLPVVLVGLLGWHSAWQGQRSQFGYSRADRADYQSGEVIAADFGYLRGTYVPPETAMSMQAMAAWRAAQPESVRSAVFYGPGLEWLERPWPTSKLPNMPLWMHRGTSYGSEEERRLLAAFSAAGPYRHVIVPEARDHWDPLVAAHLKDKHEMKRVGPVWFRYDKLPMGTVSWRPLEFLQGFGGNANSMQMESVMALHKLSDGRTFLGVERSQGELRLLAPSYRIQVEAVLRRTSGNSGPREGKARFEVFSLSGGNSYPRGIVELGLDEEQEEQVLIMPVDSGGSPLRFVVTVPAGLEGHVVAGWRAVKILHSHHGPEAPTVLRAGARDIHPAGADMRAALLPPDWNPTEVYLRDAHPAHQGVELRPGGEIWIRLEGMFSEISGIATVTGRKPGRVDPVVRVLFFKGAKLDLQAQSAIREPAQDFAFKGWSAERDGWLVIMLEPYPTSPSVYLRLTGMKKMD